MNNNRLARIIVWILLIVIITSIIFLMIFHINKLGNEREDFCKSNGYDNFDIGRITEPIFCYRIHNDSTIDKRSFRMLNGEYYFEEDASKGIEEK